MKITSIQYNLDKSYVLWSSHPHVWKDKKYNYLVTVNYEGEHMVWHSSLKPNKKNALHYLKLLKEQVNS